MRIVAADEYPWTGGCFVYIHGIRGMCWWDEMRGGEECDVAEWREDRTSYENCEKGFYRVTLL